jgi:hypothetical protein
MLGHAQTVPGTNRPRAQDAGFSDREMRHGLRSNLREVGEQAFMALPPPLLRVGPPLLRRPRLLALRRARPRCPGRARFARLGMGRARLGFHRARLGIHRARRETAGRGAGRHLLFVVCPRLVLPGARHDLFVRMVKARLDRATSSQL